MYNDYFGFKEAPFSIAPDPRYLYMTPQHREALAHLVYGLNSEGGCILLTGEVGTGKTTVCRCLLEQVPETAHIALVLNPRVSAAELLATICDELKISYPAHTTSIKTYIDLINRFLIDANARNEKTVLIIDEAQNLDSSVLEQLRLLTNLETNQRKLLQIIILGQPELLDILARADMRQLAQRITARFHLNALSAQDIKAYIAHRLAVAGQNVQLFPDATLQRLYRLSHGIPRLINILCDRALLGCYVQHRHSVDKRTLNTAAKEVFGELKNVETRQRRQHWPRYAIATVIIAVASGSLIHHYFNRDNNSAIVLQSNPAITTLEPEISPATVVQDSPGDTSTTNTSSSIDNSNITQTSAHASEPMPVITTQPDTISTLREFIANAGDNSKATAYAQMFLLWGKSIAQNHLADACGFADSQGLSCLHLQGNLNSLKHIDRPAVLQLFDDVGNSAWLTLKQLHTNRAVLVLDNTDVSVSIDELEAHWYGDYSLLWQKPPYYQGVLQPGARGPLVQWLDQQMARLDNTRQLATIRDHYSAALVSQVEAFQQSRGLVADGMVGPMTFIHINSALGLDVPRLLGKHGE